MLKSNLNPEKSKSLGVAERNTQKQLITNDSAGFDEFPHAFWYLKISEKKPISVSTSD